MNIREFQDGVRSWVERCMGVRVARSPNERCRRFLEEALELVQAGGLEASKVMQMVSYVYNRPAGDMAQEVGGVSVTLAALCSAYNLDLEYCAYAELQRIEANMEAIREKHNHKAALGYAEYADGT